MVRLVVQISIVLLLVAIASTGLISARGNRNLAPRSVVDPSTQTPAIGDQDNGTRISLKENEIDYDEKSIDIGEPYKSLLKTTARFAIAQSKLSNHFNLDTMMNLLSDATYYLARPVILIKLLKLLVPLVFSLTITIMLVPGGHSFINSLYRDPMNTLNLDRYFTNGVSEKSVLSILGTKTDETLSRVGLQDTSCRERSLCYMGEILRCSLPTTSESITKFASENFANSEIKDYVFARAFISGFVDRNCTNIGIQENSPIENRNCLANFINSMLGESRTPRRRREDPRWLIND